MPCECATHCRAYAANLLTKHHRDCPHYDPESDARELIDGLINAWNEEARETDGVPGFAIEAYNRACIAVGRRQITTAEPVPAPLPSPSPIADRLATALRLIETQACHETGLFQAGVEFMQKTARAALADYEKAKGDHANPPSPLCTCSGCGRVERWGPGWHYVGPTDCKRMVCGRCEEKK